MLLYECFLFRGVRVMKRFFMVGLTLWLVSLVSFTPGWAAVTPDEAKSWIESSTLTTRDGSLVVHIEGKPYVRGFQYGYRLAEPIVRFRDYIALEFQHNTKRSFDFFTDAAVRLYADRFNAEMREEMQGMVDGVNFAGKSFSYPDILAINTYFDVNMWWDTIESKKESANESDPAPEPQKELNPESTPIPDNVPNSEKDHCSAFIAVGEMTRDGEIVMAHNTWFDYSCAPFCRIVLEIVPDRGHKMLMQNWAGMLFSGTDFFLTDVGLVGCETTIGAFKSFDPDGIPISQRARMAMQYGENITDWVERISDGNNGAYANAWLLGDIRTGEIARLELGLKYQSLERTRNGHFTGSNIAENPLILKEETTRDPHDSTHHSVGRRVRWQQLMRQYQGRLDLETAQKLLADHFDSYVGEDRPGLRSLCGHAELASGSFEVEPGPWGAIDGKVVTGELAKQWSFMGRWGRSCDIGFDAQKFLDEHPKYEWMHDFLNDIHVEPWTKITFPSQK